MKFKRNEEDEEVEDILKRSYKKFFIGFLKNVFKSPLSSSSSSIPFCTVSVSEVQVQS